MRTIIGNVIIILMGHNKGNNRIHNLALNSLSTDNWLVIVAGKHS